MTSLTENDSNFPARKDAWLEAIMDRYGENLTKMAYNYVKDWKLAEDSVQDVFVVCCHHYDKLYEILDFKPWIYRITINKSKDMLKSASYRKTVIQSSLLTIFKSNDPPPDMLLIKRSEEETLSKSVLKLPVKYREVIILYYYEELSIAKIGDILNLNSNTVKTRLKTQGIKLPENIPGFVEQQDFEEIDWDRKAVNFDRGIIGNENKSGVIGIDMPSLTPQKWMWHL
ncbi:sigma-70 family RNA polymerase sigma factor [Rossellomorea vietnamensis]|uniref:sigma-70 family RNA polymerase sigma factor n=1 Tax=Rossellomorea vietnamensis TaxID=218284 RepID=UPI002078CA86|nr:sigma-70 family RNA polymerase sigma factor [Rossellomorea vietnamensis]